MIISHKYKFIFIKILKAASTSMEIALEKMCGPEDIVTPIKPPLESHHPRNYGDFYNHIVASEIKSRVSADVWNNYYKFCFERNPWDKLVSLFWWDIKRRKLRNESFREYILHFDEDHPRWKKKIQFAEYAIDGKVVVDFIGRYENLNLDFKKVCDNLGLPFDGIFTKEKSERRPKEKHYSTYYDAETKELVRKRFSRKIALLGYSFDEK